MNSDFFARNFRTVPRVALAILISLSSATLFAQNATNNDSALVQKAAAQPVSKVEGAGWKPLFDGHSLAGWRITDFGGHGPVHTESGMIIAELGDSLTGVDLTNVVPKNNYEITLEGIKLEGSDFFCGLTFPVKDSFCSLILGGWGGAVAGLSSIDGQDASENESTQFLKFETNHWYRIRVRVTDTKIQAWLDKNQIIDAVITGKKIALRFGEIEMSKPFGLATYQTTAAWRDIKVRPLEEFETVSPEQRDVVYGHAGGETLKMDIYNPGPDAPRPAPVVVHVHGGGWEGGDKADVRWALAIPELLKRGYLVASINYRFAPQFPFPAQIEDAKCAIRYLRAKAVKYELDPERIGVWGGSAGGHLVALLGLTDSKAGFDGTGGNPDQSSAVQAVVDLYGPTELTSEFSTGNEALMKLAREVYGSTNLTDPIFKTASPITYVKKDAPPFLILQGDKDTLVPLEQSQKLQAALTAIGASSTLVVVTNGQHGFMAAGGKVSPSEAELEQMIADFFDRTVKKH